VRSSGILLVQDEADFMEYTVGSGCFAEAFIHLVFSEMVKRRRGRLCTTGYWVLQNCNHQVAKGKGFQW